MADDAGDWFAATDDAPPAKVPSLLKKKKKEAAPEPPPPKAAEEAGDVPGGEEGEEFLPEAELEPIDPDKLLLFKHWIRPRFLQYSYLYDYRHNYYNDVIDYLDKRQKGVLRDVPRAQTWAERALRTYNSKITRKNYFNNQKEDTKLCTKIRLSGRFHIFHSREYINRKYSSVL